MIDFSIIVAMDAQRGIGSGGQLMWHLPSDMKHFKGITLAARAGKRNAVIMGRKTWESIPSKFRPLAGRINIVLSRNSGILLPEDCMRFSDLTACLKAVSDDHTIDQIFIIGGGSVYAQGLALPGCKKLYVTRIEETFDCDVFFPEIPADFRKTSQTAAVFENNCHFLFEEYSRCGP